MCFVLCDKFNGSIIFDIRGQHEVLEVNVITNIRTIINYPCRPLSITFLKQIDDAIGYNESSTSSYILYPTPLLKVTSEMMPNRIRNHCRQHKCNRIVANGHVRDSFKPLVWSQI